MTAYDNACRAAYHRLVETFERRAKRPNDAPHMGALTALGSPWDGKWKNHKPVLQRALGHYDEATVPACALGVLWFICGRPDHKAYSLTDIGGWAGLTWYQSAALVNLTDAGASWGELAQEMRSWRAHEKALGRQPTQREVFGGVCSFLADKLASGNVREGSLAELHKELQALIIVSDKLKEAAKKPKAMPEPKSAKPTPAPLPIELPSDLPPPLQLAA